MNVVPSRIDVHAHFLPEFYRDALVGAGITRPDGMPGIPAWSEGAALAAMDELTIGKAYLSISSPGVHLGDDAAARDLARRVNVEGQRLRTRYPQRFGFFASVPLPDIEGAIEASTCALDELSADGIVVETNHCGVYLGDERLEPFYAALAARGAVLFIHPTSPACTDCPTLALGYPRPMLEFMFETTRSVTNMILSGVTQRYPQIRIIVPHAGAALSIFASRIESFSASFADRSTNDSSGTPDFRAELRKLYYDLAGAPLPELIDALLKIADPDHVLYGSDWPFTPLPACKQLANKLEESPCLDAAARAAIMRLNAELLFAVPDVHSSGSPNPLLRR